MTVGHPSFSRRLRALLFQVRAIVVFVALAIGIVFWMLAGIVGAAVASLLHALFNRKREDAWHTRMSRHSFIAPDSSSAPVRAGSLPTWLRG